MQKLNRKIVSMVLLSTLLVSGYRKNDFAVGRSQMTPEKREKIEEIRKSVLNEKVKNCSIKKLPVYSVGLFVLIGNNKQERGSIFYKNEKRPLLRTVGIIKFDVDNDGIYSEKMGDFFSFIDLYYEENIKFLDLFVDGENNFQNYFFYGANSALNDGILTRGKEVVFVFPDNMNLKVMNSSFVLRVKNKKDFSFLKIPSNILSGFYKDTDRLKELDTVFAKDYLNKGR